MDAYLLLDIYCLHAALHEAESTEVKVGVDDMSDHIIHKLQRNLYMMVIIKA